MARPAGTLLTLEQQIAQAHQVLWRAANLAAGLDMEILSDDLNWMLRALEEIQVELLRGRKPRGVRGRPHTLQYASQSNKI